MLASSPVASAARLVARTPGQRSLKLAATTASASLADDDGMNRILSQSDGSADGIQSLRSALQATPMLSPPSTAAPLQLSSTDAAAQLQQLDAHQSSSCPHPTADTSIILDRQQRSSREAQEAQQQQHKKHKKSKKERKKARKERREQRKAAEAAAEAAATVPKSRIVPTLRIEVNRDGPAAAALPMAVPVPALALPPKTKAKLTISVGLDRQQRLLQAWQSQTQQSSSQANFLSQWSQFMLQHSDRVGQANLLYKPLVIDASGRALDLHALLLHVLARGGYDAIKQDNIEVWSTIREQLGIKMPVRLDTIYRTLLLEFEHSHASEYILAAQELMRSGSSSMSLPSASATSAVPPPASAASGTLLAQKFSSDSSSMDSSFSSQMPPSVDTSSTTSSNDDKSVVSDTTSIASASATLTSATLTAATADQRAAEVFACVSVFDWIPSNCKPVERSLYDDWFSYLLNTPSYQLLKNPVVINGEALDLYHLYHATGMRGGYDKVQSNPALWRQIAAEMHNYRGRTSLQIDSVAAENVAKLYKDLLLSYERYNNEPMSAGAGLTPKGAAAASAASFFSEESISKYRSSQSAQQQQQSQQQQASVTQQRVQEKSLRQSVAPAATTPSRPHVLARAPPGHQPSRNSPALVKAHLKKSPQVTGISPGKPNQSISTSVAPQAQPTQATAAAKATDSSVRDKLPLRKRAWSALQTDAATSSSSSSGAPQRGGTDGTTSSQVAGDGTAPPAAKKFKSAA